VRKLFAQLELLDFRRRGSGQCVDKNHVSGSAKALDSSTSLLKVGARLILVGLGSSEIPWPLGPFDVSTSFAYDDSDFAAAVNHIVSGRVRLGQLLTHTFDLGETAAAIDASANDASVIKAAVKPG
jgi:threonine dehydrogenase-like Zn-dependent dehydrogenase